MFYIFCFKQKIKNKICPTTGPAVETFCYFGTDYLKSHIFIFVHVDSTELEKQIVKKKKATGKNNPNYPVGQ